MGIQNYVIIVLYRLIMLIKIEHVYRTFISSVHAVWFVEPCSLLLNTYTCAIHMGFTYMCASSIAKVERRGGTHAHSPHHAASPVCRTTLTVVAGSHWHMCYVQATVSASCRWPRAMLLRQKKCAHFCMSLHCFV